MNALGVRPLMQHLGGEIAHEEAFAQAQAETRQYAKRQLTWARRNMITWTWLSKKEMESSVEKIITFIDS